VAIVRLTENSGDRTIHTATVLQKMPMICDSFTYTTFGDVCVSHTISEVNINTAWKDRLLYLDFQSRGFFTSTYKCLGMRGFVNSPLKLTTSRLLSPEQEYSGMFDHCCRSIYPTGKTTS